MLNEEFIKEDMEEKIALFRKSAVILKNAIKENKKVSHKEKEMFESLVSIANDICKEFSTKEKSHQNTSTIKNVYSTMMKTLYVYNILLNSYNSKVEGRDKLKTLGDFFREKGMNTVKDSVATYFNY